VSTGTTRAQRGVSAGLALGATLAERHGEPAERHGAARAGRAGRRALWRCGSFAALALYGALRWGTMLSPHPTARLLGLVGVSLALAAIGALPIRRRWPWSLAAALLALGAVLALAGLPLEWITHARVAVIARAIGAGLSGLPNVLVPYGGGDPALREVILLGAGVLLLDGALMLAFGSAELGELRLAVAALPLLVAALVPSALGRPPLPYLQGALLFALLVAFVFGERVGRGGRLPLGLMALATAGAMALAPTLDPHRPWVNFERLTGTLAPSGETFDWNQTYGPLQWPANGQRVLTVTAPRPAYWKTESLNDFNGRGWTTGPVSDSDPLLGASAASLRRYTETVQVAVEHLTSSQVIAAGTELAPPVGLQGTISSPNVEQDDYELAPPLHPGEIYTVRVYAPDPSAAQLQRAGTDYPPVVAGSFLDVTLPAFANRQAGLALPPSTVHFAPFGSFAGATMISPGQMGPAQTASTIAASPYARAYALAQRLAAGAATPYAYARAIESYLSHGFTYATSPQRSPLPLETFLFKTRLGYCQQFAGAMALLLRMGGVPARVATGFLTGRSADPASPSLGISDDPQLLPAIRREAASIHARTYFVSDIDAHAWVEAWFPGYGWVDFDPTPASSQGSGSLSGALIGGSATAGYTPKGRLPRQAAHGSRLGAGGRGRGRAAAGGSSALWPLVPLALLAVALIASALLLARGRRRLDPLAELERAFARSGRPLAAGTTLAGVEERLRGAPEAAGYVRALRLARYGAAAAPAASAGQRRALRAQLARGTGPFGRLRALWALPPRAPKPPLRRRRTGA
jgi:transglutaminase-like putative cysteine protease